MVSSLKHGIFRSLFKERALPPSQPPPLGEISLFKPSTWMNIKHGYEREKKIRKFQVDLQRATNDLLPQEQFEALFWAFHRISEIFVELSSAQASLGVD